MFTSFVIGALALMVLCVAGTLLALGLAVLASPLYALAWLRVSGNREAFAAD